MSCKVINKEHAYSNGRRNPREIPHRNYRNPPIVGQYKVIHLTWINFCHITCARYYQFNVLNDQIYIIANMLLVLITSAVPLKAKFTITWSKMRFSDKFCLLSGCYESKFTILPQSGLIPLIAMLETPVTFQVSKIFPNLQQFTSIEFKTIIRLRAIPLQRSISRVIKWHLFAVSSFVAEMDTLYTVLNTSESRCRWHSFPFEV